MTRDPMVLIIVPSHRLGGPLRVVANRPLTGPRPARNPGVLLSYSRPPAHLRASAARRIAGSMRRDVGRPIVVPELALIDPLPSPADRWVEARCKPRQYR